jgi:hypothetical protein
MPGIGEQRERPGHDSGRRLSDDIGDVERNPDRKGAPEIHRAMPVRGMPVRGMRVGRMIVLHPRQPVRYRRQYNRKIAARRKLAAPGRGTLIGLRPGLRFRNGWEAIIRNRPRGRAAMRK